MSREPDTGEEIERLIAAEDWTPVRRSITRALRRAPEDHWLLSRLALTFYEQHRYAQALELEREAVSVAPHCPLALWGMAGSLRMVGRPNEAEDVYRRLLRRGAARLGREQCGEGLRWARGLVADCWYRVGQILQARGESRAAMAAYRQHLKLRRLGGSIYTFVEVTKRIRGLAPRKPGPQAISARRSVSVASPRGRTILKPG